MDWFHFTIYLYSYSIENHDPSHKFLLQQKFATVKICKFSLSRQTLTCRLLLDFFFVALFAVLVYLFDDLGGKRRLKYKLEPCDKQRRLKYTSRQ